ncbi:hypothetical protein LEMLEM_LOCUS16544, partial [Lemmus lemmus]
EQEDPEFKVIPGNSVRPTIKSKKKQTVARVIRSQRQIRGLNLKIREAEQQATRETFTSPNAQTAAAILRLQRSSDCGDPQTAAILRLRRSSDCLDCTVSPPNLSLHTPLLLSAVFKTVEHAA